MPLSQPKRPNAVRYRREILLQVYAESVLASDVPGMVGDFWNRCEALFELRDGLAIDAHVGIVGISQQTNHSRFFRDEAAT